jgi:hypothetical protein
MHCTDSSIWYHRERLGLLRGKWRVVHPSMYAQDCKRDCDSWKPSPPFGGGGRRGSAGGELSMACFLVRHRGRAHSGLDAKAGNSWQRSSVKVGLSARHVMVTRDQIQGRGAHGMTAAQEMAAWRTLEPSILADNGKEARLITTCQNVMYYKVLAP